MESNECLWSISLLTGICPTLTRLQTEQSVMGTSGVLTRRFCVDCARMGNGETEGKWVYRESNKREKSTCSEKLGVDRVCRRKGVGVGVSSVSKRY